MTYSESDIRYNQAKVDPASVYQGPMDVVNDKELTLAMKEEILRRWEYDAREIAVAEDEGMKSYGNEATFERIIQARKKLRELNQEGEIKRESPTKQGGGSGLGAP